MDKFDIIILGATGPIFDNYYLAVKKLSKHLKNNGIIIIEETYTDDINNFKHSPLLSRKELLKQFKQGKMKLIDEIIVKYSEIADTTKEMKNMTKRCNELKAKYPKKSSLFENHIKNQALEYDILENKVSGSVMVLKNMK